MKKYLPLLFLALFFFFLCNKAHGQDIVVNGAKTSPINFPAGSCVYTWTNNNTSIGLAASGTGNIPSFTAVNTGSSPVTATITGTPVGTGFAYVVNAGSNSVSVINIATSAVVATISVGSNPNGVSVDPNYNEVYVVNNSANTVSVINTLTNTVKATVAVGPSPWSVTVSPDGTRAYVADGGNNDVEVINTTTNTIVATIPAGNNPNALAVSPDGSLIYVNNSNKVTVINTTTQAVVANIPVGAAPQAILITPDGSKVYEANYASNNVYVINTATNTVAGIIPVGTNPGGGSMSPDGSFVYIANEGSNSVSVISTATNSVIKTIAVGASPWGVSVRPDGTQIYVANSGSNSISVVNAATNAIIANIPVGSEPYSFGNFFTGGMNCTELVKYTITVNPTPAPLPTITTGTATGSISACAGTASASPQIQQFTVSGNNLTGNITATAPAGFEISLAAGSGYAGSITIPQTSGTVNSTVIYVRSAAAAPTGNIFGKITLSSAGASNQTVAITGTVNALPTVNTIANQTVKNGAATTAVNFTGTGNAFTWVNDTPGIGLAASGTGDIASFTAINTGSSPVVAKVTVTPVNAGLAYIANAATIGTNTYASDTVYVVNTVTGNVVSKIVAGASSDGVSVSPDDSRVYVANFFSNTVSVINTSTNTVVATISVGMNPWWIAVSPDGTRIFVSNVNSNNVSVINTATNTVIATVTVGTTPQQGPGYLAISPDSKLVYVTYGGQILVINSATNAVISATTFSPGNLAGITLSPDGSKLYAEDNINKSLDVIDLATNAITATIAVGNGGEQGILINGDGSRLYVTNGNSYTVSVINTAINSVIATIPVGGDAGPMSLTSDGSELYVENAFANNVSVINTATNQVIKTIPVGTGPFGFGNFITKAGCTGAPVTFTITVNPTTLTITATAATGTISACAGSASASPQIQQFTVSGSGLTANITATAPTDFEVSLSANSGYGNSVIIPQASGTATNTVVYVRSAAGASAGSISGNVTLTSAGATSQNVAVTGTVNALPTVNAVANQTVNNGAATATVNFTGTGSSFTWVNDTPGIGLAASGTWDIASFAAVNTGSSPVVATITATPVNSGFAYVANLLDGTVSVIDIGTTAVSATIKVGQQPVCVSLSPDGNRAYVSNQRDNTVSVIDTKSNIVIATVPVNFYPLGITVSPDNSKVYVVNHNAGNISVINTVSNTVVANIPESSDIWDVRVSPDGSKLYATDYSSNTLTVIDVNTSTTITKIPMGPFPLELSLTPDGSRLYVTNTNSNTISVVNTSTNKVVADVVVGASPKGIVVTPDGKRVYVANFSDGTVSVISTATNTVIATIAVGANPYGVSVSSDGARVLVTNTNSNNVSVINTATNSVINTIDVGNYPQSSGNLISRDLGCDGAPVKFTITVNPSPPTITTSIATGTISACAGTASASPNIQQFTVSGSGLKGDLTATAPADFEISLTAGSGYGSSVVIAQTRGAVNSTVVYVRSAATAATGSISGNVTLSSPGAPNQTVAVTATVNAVVTASLTISASGNNICAGTPITFTAAPTNGGSSPVYQWLVNGANAGTNSPTFASSTLANGDVVSCVMTSSTACVAPALTTSNSITMNVTAAVIPSISIAASQNAICAGTPVTFTATPINGGSTSVYQWLVNGTNAGTNSATFSSSNFADGDIVSCMMTSNAGCATPVSAPSNSITLSVSPMVSPAIIIAASQNNICPGTNVTFTATPTNGGGSPVYQWLLNGNNTGLNSPTYASSSLANGDVISCRLTSNATCITIPGATSSSITMVVNDQAVPAVSIAISANNVCAGTPLTFTATPTNGGSSPAYQWQVNGNNAGTNSPTYSSSTFANGDMVTCVMTSSLACAAPTSITSNSIITNIFPLPVVNAGGDKTIKKGSSVALTASTSGNITDITWSPSAGLDNNKILNPQASPVSTTSYTITVQTAAGCMASDSVTVTVFDGIAIPNTFTPNGDGMNDKWDIQNLNDYQNCVVHIFDRYGGEVYSSKGYYSAWDGTINGRRLPSGTYYYLINLNNGTQPLSGFVALIR